MGFRLARWWNRGSASAGRHVRVMPAASVPGAASTLVSSVSLDPVVTGVATVRTESPTVTALSASRPTPPVPAASLGESQLVAPDPVATSAGVGLVFADGASVQLDPDDPRVRTFRAAAAALMEPPIR